MIFTTSGTEGDVVSSIEDNFGLGNGSIVFEFSLSDGGTVVAEDDELGIAWSEGLEGGLISEDVLTALHDEGKFAVNILSCSFLDHFCLISLWIVNIIFFIFNLINVNINTNIDVSLYVEINVDLYVQSNCVL